MREEAPNVAMVWTPFEEPQSLIDEYYPGDEWVDRVGMNIYSVYVHDGDPLRRADQEDPVAFLRYIYDRYADRKPIHISEFAATVYCKGTTTSTVDFAIEKMKRFYTALIQEFPRVKSVNWFCLDTVKAGLANNNYSVLSDKRVLAEYSALISDNHFLSQVAYDPETFSIRPAAGTTLGLNPRGGTSGDDLLANSGSVAATITEPWIRGLKSGDVVHGDLLLRVQLPLGLQARGFIWQVDGRTVALTNTAPYRVVVPFEKLGAGPHTAQVLVITKAGFDNQVPSPQIQFTLEP